MSSAAAKAARVAEGKMVVSSILPKKTFKASLTALPEGDETKETEKNPQLQLGENIPRATSLTNSPPEEGPVVYPLHRSSPVITNPSSRHSTGTQPSLRKDVLRLDPTSLAWERMSQATSPRNLPPIPKMTSPAAAKAARVAEGKMGVSSILSKKTFTASLTALPEGDETKETEKNPQLQLEENISRATSPTNPPPPEEEPVVYPLHRSPPVITNCSRRHSTGTQPSLRRDVLHRLDPSSLAWERMSQAARNSSNQN
jgi:hypothetical protein